MNSEKLMEMALGLKQPWEINSVEFKAGPTQQAELHITVAFKPGSYFDHHQHGSITCFYRGSTGDLPQSQHTL